MLKNNVYVLKMHRKTTENLTLISQNKYVFSSRHYYTIFKEFENLSVEKMTLSTALGFEPRSLRYKSLKLSTRTPVDNVSYLIRD